MHRKQGQPCACPNSGQPRGAAPTVELQSAATALHQIPGRAGILLDRVRDPACEELLLLGVEIDEIGLLHFRR